MFIPGTDNRQGLGTLGHHGIFIGQSRSLGIKNHIDIPYVTALAPEKPLDFGIVTGKQIGRAHV